MFKIDKKTNKISITKGDNAEILISVVDADNKQRKIFDDDRITLTVRKNALSDEVIIEKVANGNSISFIPADTSSVPIGIYKYDIQLNTFNGKVYTIVPSAYFEILEEITR